MSIMATPWKHPNGTYYIRRKVPEPLRASLGEFFKRSLGTKDLALAKTKFAAMWAVSEEHFAMAKASLEGAPPLTAKDVQQVAARWFHEELSRMEASGDFTRYLLIEELPEGVEVSTFRGHLEGAPIDAETLRPFITEALERHGLPVLSEQSETYTRLLGAFSEHLLKLSGIAAQRHEGEWTAQADVLPLEPLSIESKRTVTEVKKLLALFEDYSADRLANDGSNRTTRKTLDEYRGVIVRFVQLYGDLPVTEITRALVQEYRLDLSKTPSKGEGIRLLSAREQIERAQKEDLETLSQATIRKRLKVLSSVLGFGVHLGVIRENPVVASGVVGRLSKAISKDGRSRRRKDFNDEELRTIFTGPVYTRGWKPPKADLGGALHWVPLLALYTGARREELCQLFVRDVKKSPEGILYLSILDTPEDDLEEDGRTVKTTGSRRSVPLHPDLIELGFVEYLEAQPADGQLFPMLQKDGKGWYGKGYGRHWVKYMRGVLKLKSPASPSHGFRHTFKTLCRSAGVPEDVSDAMSGHRDGSVSRSYGSMGMARKAEELAKFPSIARQVGLLPQS